MRSYVIVLMIGLLGLAAVVHAQDTGTAEREIYTVLNYGEDVFEPDLWFTSATESASRTTATWTAKPDSGFAGGLAYADYLHFDDSYSMDGLDTMFSDDWFDGILANYESYSSTISCGEMDSLRLYEFAVVSNDENYIMRYWVEPASEDRVMAMFLVFPAKDVEARRMMEDYARRLFPDLPACPR
ncbi:MAG: hypothetical protein K8L99_35915 [Anaerolineae bacterium]|nr:hypothetical protein [Anaerolineae bacterium]